MDMSMSMGLRGGAALREGVSASAYGSSPAPAGYHWEFVTWNGEVVTSRGVPVVDLVRD